VNAALSPAKTTTGPVPGIALTTRTNAISLLSTAPAEAVVDVSSPVLDVTAPVSRLSQPAVSSIAAPASMLAHNPLNLVMATSIVRLHT
jgi:hypothetical protein